MQAGPQQALLAMTTQAMAGTPPRLQGQVGPPHTKEPLRR